MSYKEYTLRVIIKPNQGIDSYLEIGRKWWIHEGPKCVGKAEILDVELPF